MTAEQEREYWVSLRDHLQQILDVRFDQISQRFEMLQRAVDKAEKSMDNRMAQANEFRDSLKDQASRFITTTTLDDKLGNVFGQLNQVSLRVSTLEQYQSGHTGESVGSKAAWGIAVTLITVILNVLFFLLRK